MSQDRATHTRLEDSCLIKVQPDYFYVVSVKKPSRRHITSPKHLRCQPYGGSAQAVATDQGSMSIRCADVTLTRRQMRRNWQLRVGSTVSGTLSSEQEPPG